MRFRRLSARSRPRDTPSRTAAQKLIEHTLFRKFSAANVIEKEEGPRADHGDIVYAMIHQVDADGVVLVHRKSDLQFRPDTVDAGDENRILDPTEARGIKTAEPADARENFWAVRLPNDRS